MDYPEIKIADIKGKDVGMPISIIGTIGKLETQYPYCSKALFMCLRCGYLTVVEQTFPEPLQPPLGGCGDETCGKLGPFRLVEDRSIFFDVQETIVLQLGNHGIDAYSEPDWNTLKVYLVREAVGKVEGHGYFKLSGKIIREKVRTGRFEYVLVAEDVVPTADPTLIKEKETEKKTSDWLFTESMSQRNKIKKVRSIIQTLQEDKNKEGAFLEDVYSEAEKEGIDREAVKGYILKMKQGGDLLTPLPDHVRLVN